MRSSIYVIGLGLIVSCSSDEPGESSLHQESALEERQQLAASGRFLVPQSQGLGVLSDESMIAALDIPAGLTPVITQRVIPDPTAVFDTPGIWRIRPTRGGSLLVLSTGQTNLAGTPAEPGADFTPAGTAGDLSRLRIELTAPAGADQVSFDYTFLSSESPEFVGTNFNDTFTATVSDALGANRQIALASVNSAEFHEASETRVGAGPFLLYTDFASNVDLVFGPENFPPGTPLVTDAGTTDLQRVTADIRAVGRITLEFTIQDLGDGILDSAVLIDNVSFSALQLVDPNTEQRLTSLVDENGQVVTDPVLLADQERGVVVDRIAADGATRLLLRRRVSGPGTVTFALDAANAGDGGFATHHAIPAAWLDTITVNTVMVGGVHYAFALYKAPEDFVAVAAPEAVNGQVNFSMQFTPDGQPARPAQPATIEVVRPPVVVVPDLWSNCETWLETDSIIGSSPAGFTISCASYDSVDGTGKTISTLSFGFDNDQNLAVLPEHVHERLKRFREDRRAAVTQVDVVGHGMGGLFARRYIDGVGAPYRTSRNYNEGSVNRLVTLGTPHLGARFADEAVRFREAMICAGDLGANRNWPYVNNSLANSNAIRIEKAGGHVALDEMISSSPVLLGLGVTPVPSHAIVGAGGADATRIQWRSMGGGAPSNDVGVANQLFLFMETYHPLSLQTPADPRSALLATAERNKLLHYPVTPTVPVMASKVFCPISGRQDLQDDNDFFATVQEQRGGLGDHAVTTVPIVVTEFKSAHFKMHTNRAHRDAIVAALNSPIVVPPNAPPGTQSKFAPFLPAPGALIAGKTNRCPINIPPPAPGFCAAGAAAQAPVASLNQTLQITQPADGAAVGPGATVTMTVAHGSEQPELVVLSNGSDTVELYEPPFSATLTVPSNALGTVRFTALAFYPGGGLVEATPVNVQVQSSATLTELSVLNGDAVILRPGRTRQLTVIGTYSNGARRNLTSGQLGTRYAVSSIGTVAMVGPHGLVTGLAPGNATVVVRNGNRITSINVEVGAGQCGDGEIDPGEQCDDGGRADGDGCDRNCRREEGPTAVCSNPTVCNDQGTCAAEVTDLGAGSSDPDGNPLTITQTPPGPYSVGSHTVAVNVSNGEEDAQCSSALSVLDCEGPSLTCPGAFAVECTGGGGADVTPPAADGSDNCGAVQVTSPSGGFLPLGSATLAYRANDPAGNQATCTTTVTVQDTTAPLLICPPPAVAECAGNGQAVVDPGDASTIDGCTTATVSEVAPGSYPLGTTPVGYTAIDQAGNQAQCSGSVTVLDSIAPMVTCPAPIVAECTSPSGAQVTPASATASDSCTGTSITGPSAGFYPLGTTPVAYVARDSTGNEAACSSPIQVVDTQPPTVGVTPPAPLFPVDGEYRTINLADCGVTVQDTCGGSLTLEQAGAQITCVTSDEVDDKPNNPDDGNTVNDIVIVSSTQVKVRAERLQQGDGRVYEIKFRVRDASGNVSNGVCPVAVPAPICHPRPGFPGCGGRDNGDENTVCSQ
jgi:cysteine-rich repeat protein